MRRQLRSGVRAIHGGSRSCGSPGDGRIHIGLVRRDVAKDTLLVEVSKENCRPIDPEFHLPR